jgi:antitoxin component YwqK of YwqJK toxin-antitoxin module
MHLVMGVYDGRYTSWFENGRIEQEGNYKKGQEYGEWRYYWENGNLKQVQATHTANDTITNYYKNSKLKDQTFYHDYRRHGDYLKYDTLGNKVTYRHFTDGIQDSLQIAYYPSGVKAEAIQFKDGRRNGQYKAWHSNGKLKTTGQYYYSVPIFIWKEYDEAGKLSKTINSDNEVITPGVDYNGDENYPMQISSESDMADVGFQLPTISDGDKAYVISKADKMKFLSSHAFIDVLGVMDENGKISFTVVTPLKPADREKFTNYLNAHFGTGQALNWNGKPIPCTISVRVIIAKI